jgi:hypothetical protein
MKKILSHENRMIVYNLKNVLQGEGIETHVVNEFAAGGAGDLATFDTWPELWLDDDGQQQQAQKIIDGILDGKEEGHWFCRACQEQNASSFKLCWNCGGSYE